MESFINLLLAASGAFHLHHLNAVTHARHILLQQAYEAATKHADAIMEQILANDPSAAHNITNLSIEVSTPEALLDALIQTLNGMLTASVAVTPPPPNLENVMQDALSEFNQIKYLLSMR